MTNDLFIQATRQAIRFNHKGQISVEDLWHLNLETLDVIAKGLYKQLQENVDISFINETTKSDKAAQLKLDIVKYIISVKLEEKEAVRIQTEKAHKRQHLAQLIFDKQKEALSAKSIEELQAELDNL